ncbi:MAG: hypothetical protein H6587_06135 [Flavobacteriales bacterium]|nr:hypothetical protein [Flavobacteriales bacterium]MCB9364126.1 hypothetical protein [Flavobacteriales bacterium]
MHNVKNYILLLLIGWTLGACNKQDLEAEIPAYISISNFSFSTTANQGTASHKITDAWVYLDQELLGVFELPVRFPVVKEGNFKLDVYPGVKENGIAERRNRYLFYNGYTTSITLEKNKTVEITPSTTYTSGATFYWMEDFESASLPFLYNTISDTVMNKTSSDVFEGNFSGRVVMTPSMDFFECFTPSFSSLPRFGKTIFMELDFKTNQPVLMGIYADSEQIGLFYLNTTSDWNKIYLNLTEAIQTRASASEYKMFFGFENKVGTPEFLVDNIKIIYI